MNSLINHRAARELALDHARKIGRAGIIERVGAAFYAAVDAAARAKIKALVSSHPSGYKTLQG